MWRAVFAFSLVDNALSIEEQELLRGYLKTVPFSAAQMDTLKTDFEAPQNVEAMYRKITDPAHKKRFCILARALVWCEGDMDMQEEKILRRVACLKDAPDNDFLRTSRDHPDIDNFYQHYARAGMIGLMRSSSGLRISA
ncbi:MAG: TerB family tellurite resistance protein [Alphaproteobacteria bacterium PRO2]|nr:TerB family tellurite resistance protein [Alphaproteobacteria bacterium PRO2]